MTKSDELFARQLLDTLAQVTDLLRHAAVTIGRLTRVSKTLTALEFIKSGTGWMLTGYLDAWLDNGDTLSWLLDITWTDESWIIEAKLSRSNGNDEDTIQELPREEVKGFDQFRSHLLDTTRRLLALRAPPPDQ